MLYAYTQPSPMVDVDPTSGLSLPSYASHGVNVASVSDNLSVPVAIYTMDCLTIHFFSLFLASACYITYCPHCPLWDM
jgi:hypothetical protein